MEIYFLRHGEAQDKRDGMTDEERPLTSYGAATTANVARALARKVKKLDLILTSPLLRARQTADIAGNVFGATRFHVETLTSTPFVTASSPRYCPHRHTAIATCTGHVNGLTPRESNPLNTRGLT